MQKILEQLPSGVQGELYHRQAHSVQVSFSNSQFEDISNSRQQSTTLRVIKDGRISVAQSTKPDSEALLVKNALETVAFGSLVNYQLPGAADPVSLPLADEQINQVDTQTMVDLADDFTQSLLEVDPRIKVMAGVARYAETVSMQNTAGFQGSFYRTGWNYGLGGQLVQGDDMLWLGEFQSSSRLVDDYQALKQSVIQQFTWAKQIAAFEAGSYPVIFAPSQLGFLMAPFLACLSGKAIVRDVSPWKDKLGSKLLDDRVSLIDDGTLPMQPSSQPFDREGTPTRRNRLIERGVVQQLILDLQSAALLGQQSSGNGTTGGPSPHHVLLQPGTTSFQQLVETTKLGLLILGSMGAWTGNPYSGNVSGTVSVGLKIEEGQIVGRVKNCMFSLNAFDHFRDHLEDISSDVTNLGNASYPYVMLDEVLIATK